MQSALQSKYLWMIVTGDEECPPDPDPNMKGAELKAAKKDRLEWLLRDHAAQGTIKNACENMQLPYLEKPMITTSKEMWDELRRVHKTNLNVHYLFEDLYTKKYVDGSSMDEHLTALLDIGHRIIMAGEKMEDVHIARAMVLSLPKTPSWDLIKITLFEASVESFTFEFVSAQLQQEANRRARKESGAETAS